MHTPEVPTAASLASTWAATGAALTGLAVALGAVGAHLLEPALSPDRLDTFGTATRYLVIHGLALMVVALMPRTARVAAPLLLAGSVTFSLALYLLVWTGAGAFGAVAPIGGVLMIMGWAVLAWRLSRS